MREGDLDGSGALLSGRNVDIALSGDLVNSGTIAGREVVRISAENIDNLSGRIHGGDVGLQARTDLNNISGTISANSMLVATAGRDLNNVTGVAGIERTGGAASVLGRVAGLYVTGDASGQGSLLASAGRDLTLAGSIVSNAAGGSSSLIAGRNLTLGGAFEQNTSAIDGTAHTVATRASQLTGAGAFAISAGNDLQIANSAVNAGSLLLRAGNDITNIGSSISADKALIASAGRDINLRTTTLDSAYGRNVASTAVGSIAGLYVNGAGPDSRLIVSAGRDINLAAGVIGNAGEGGTTALSALRDLNLGTVGVSSRNDLVTNANNYRKESTTSEVGSQISAAGSVLLKAGNNMTVRASEVDAGTALNVAAGNNIDITTGVATYALDQASQTVKKKTFSTKVTTKRDTVDASTAIASALTGGTVSISAGNDLNITGSAVVGEEAVALAAGNGINIAAAVDTNREWNQVVEKKSGFLSGGGGFGISYGTRTTTTDQNKDAVTQSGLARSMVGSIGGDLTLDAGNAIKVGGTDMSAGGDMTLAGKSVTIDPGKDQIDGKMETRTVQDALTLRVGGSVVNAIQAVQSVQDTVEATGNKRVQAMAAATAAMAAKNAVADIQKNGLSVSLSLTAGHSESVQTRTTSETLHTGSVLTAGNDVNIVAKGDGASSDINVIGSTISASRNVTLAADDQVNLVAAQDLESQHSESKSISAEAGVAASYSSKGGTAIGFTAAVSASQGHEDGSGTTQVNSTVNAGQKLTIASGGDTNIKGAVANANQVVADVGGNLNIESLQDTAKFDSKTQSVSVSGTVGYGMSVEGSFNQSKIQSDYASVQEQSGIKAGDGGFQIRVGGNTDLKGAVISSTEAGNAANSLVTKSLTQSEIANYATMEASSIGLSGTVTSGGSIGSDKKGDSNGAAADPGGKEMGPGGTNLMDVAKTSGPTGATPSAVALSSNNSSMTRSGISAGSITVSGDAGGPGDGQNSALVGLDHNVLTGADNSSRIDNNFDATATQTQLQVTEQFAKTVVATAAPMAAKLVGDIGEEKQEQAVLEARAYNVLAAEARSNGNADLAAAYDSKAANASASAAAWGENGVNRKALHAATQGAIAGLAGGSPGALGGAAGVIGGVAGERLGAALGEVEADRLGLQGHNRDVLVKTYTDTFVSLGGAVGGLVAGDASSASGTALAAIALQAGSAASTVDLYNRQLHATEKKIIAKELAPTYAAAHPGMTEAEAAKVLEAQLLRQVDATAAMGGGWNPDASAYLKSYSATHLGQNAGIDQWGNPVPLFGVGAGYQRLDRTIFSLAPQLTTPPPKLGVGAFANYLTGVADGIKSKIGHPVDTVFEVFDNIKSAITEPEATLKKAQAGARVVLNESAAGNFAPAGNMVGQQIGTAAVVTVAGAGLVSAKNLIGVQTGLAVPTPYGLAWQSLSPEAIVARNMLSGNEPFFGPGWGSISSDGLTILSKPQPTLYRIGTMGRSEGVEAQFWAMDSALTTPNYGAKYGMPQQNVMRADFLEIGQPKPELPLITRPAPGIGANKGGGMEAVTYPSGVKVRTFSTVDLGKNTSGKNGGGNGG